MAKKKEHLSDFDKYFGPDAPNSKALAEIAAITDPLEAIKKLYNEWFYIGNDLYYREFDNALFNMVKRIANG